MANGDDYIENHIEEENYIIKWKDIIAREDI